MINGTDVFHQTTLTVFDNDEKLHKAQKECIKFLVIAINSNENFLLKIFILPHPKKK